ncbi:MAG TPA: hypothetical protein PLL80_00315 [Candidatus Pacearchaeota archaeon]|nr:hypothetical protein [Candidatus Pacearchaeota archaeon]HOK93974.1 hypothetical protein [Candidatus Pacearchaeota archaeon]HPO75045.1 hypothetical protein [Candidatus Pacearchaeota archaeon]
MATTQGLIPIQEIRDGIVILKTGEWRAILMASSINFSLMSQEEQEAIISQYQSFFNSLDFNIQILVQSRKLNISGYLKSLEEAEKKQESELLRIQAEEYREFIKSLSEMVNLMSKNFYVIVPFYPSTFGKRELSEEDFLRNKMQIDQRINYVMAGLSRTGVQSVQLGNEEIVELLWSFYNPAELEKGTVPVFPEV